jgi:hypothetical protein
MNPTFLGTKINIIFKTTEWSELLKSLNLSSSEACLITCENNTVSVYTLNCSDTAIPNLVKTKIAEKSL